jgi:hypothetical protein
MVGSGAQAGVRENSELIRSETEVYALLPLRLVASVWARVGRQAGRQTSLQTNLNVACSPKALTYSSCTQPSQVVQSVHNIVVFVFIYSSCLADVYDAASRLPDSQPATQRPSGRTGGRALAPIQQCEAT